MADNNKNIRIRHVNIIYIFESMIIVAFVWISQVVILRLHDVIPITRVISRRVSIARSVQYHILRDDHTYLYIGEWVCEVERK